MFKKLAIATAAVFVFSLPVASFAGMILKLDDNNGTTVQVDDGGVGDSNGDAGVITFVGQVGDFDSFSVTIGSSKPQIGSATSPELSLVVSNLAASGGGTINIMLTDTDFTNVGGVPISFLNLINSALATTGDVTFEVWADNTNTEFGMGTQIGSDLTGSGVFDTSGLGIINPSNPYSLTLNLDVTVAAGAVTQFDASTSGTAVPEPGTVILFGTGLAGLGFWRWKKSQA